MGRLLAPALVHNSPCLDSHGSMGVFDGSMQALAEKESDGMAKMIYRKDTGEILGVHIFGLHAADLIHEASNAMATHQRVQVFMCNSQARLYVVLV